MLRRRLLLSGADTRLDASAAAARFGAALTGFLHLGGASGDAAAAAPIPAAALSDAYGVDDDAETTTASLRVRHQPQLPQAMADKREAFPVAATATWRKALPEL